MRKTTTHHYSGGDVRQFVKDELKSTNKRIDFLADGVDSLSERIELFSQKFDEFKNKIFKLLDKVMSKLKTIREEQTVIANKVSEHTDTLEDHETRMGKLGEVLKPQN